MGQPISIQIRPVKIEIIKSDTVLDIEQAINARLQKGYLFHGEMQSVVVGGYLYFIQAMVQTEAVPMPVPPGYNSGLLIPQP